MKLTGVGSAVLPALATLSLCACSAPGQVTKPAAPPAQQPTTIPADALTRAAVTCTQLAKLDHMLQQLQAGQTPTQDYDLVDAIAHNAAGISQLSPNNVSLSTLERSATTMKLRVDRAEASWVLDLVTAEQACLDLNLMSQTSFG